MTFADKLNAGLLKVVERTMVPATITRTVQAYSKTLYKTTETVTVIACRGSIGETDTVVEGANTVTTSTLFVSARCSPGDVVKVGKKTLTVLTVKDNDVSGEEPVIFEVTAK